MLYSIPGFGTPEEYYAKRSYIDLSPYAEKLSFQSNFMTDVLKMNWHNTLWKWFQLIPSGRIFIIMGLFLLGLYLARKNFFNDSMVKPSKFGIFFLLGLISTLISVYKVGGSISATPSNWNDIIFKAFFITGQILLSLSYFSLIMMIFKNPTGHILLKGLVAVGKMAFTNYLSQTLFGILFFYGIWGGLFGSVSLAGLWIIAFCFFLFQILFSYTWFKWLF